LKRADALRSRDGREIVGMTSLWILSLAAGAVSQTAVIAT
jgi:hypothetical protein